MTAKVGVITFPGTLDDIDAARAVLLHRNAGSIEPHNNCLSIRRDVLAAPHIVFELRRSAAQVGADGRGESLECAA